MSYYFPWIQSHLTQFLGYFSLLKIDIELTRKFQLQHIGNWLVQNRSNSNTADRFHLFQVSEGL